MRLFNDHNVYIIGAGFSRPRGLPLISDFMANLRDAHEWLSENDRAAEAASVERVLQFRLDSTSSSYRVQIDLENIEELFSLAAAQDDSLTDDICTAIAATLDFCTARQQPPRTIFTLQGNGPVLPSIFTANLKHSGAAVNGRQYEVPAYAFTVAGLVGMLDPRPKSSNAFICFNYDLLLEQSLTELEVPFSYGLSRGSYLPDPSLKGLSYESGASLELLKLHGSVNWATPNKPSTQLSIFGSYQPVREAQYVPALVPPTWRKSFAGALTHAWQAALEQISRATRLVVIGFSMPPTDLHFKYLLAAGLSRNISLREIVFVDPGREAVEARARQLFGDLQRRPTIRFVSVGTDRFVTQGAIPDNCSSIGRAVNAIFQSIYPVL
jgi:hypothetical protein